MRQLIEKSAARNSRSVKLLLQLKTYPSNPFRMSCTNIKRIIAPGPMKSGVISCTKSRLKMKGKG